jgi:transcriptional regulator with XRE-family HTH domain
MSAPTRMPTPSRADVAGNGLVRVLQQLPTVTVIVVAGALACAGTSSDEPTRVWEERYTLDMSHTDSGAESRRWDESAPGVVTSSRVRDDAIEDTRQRVAELRRLSGLTWEQMGELFGVSRRSIHFWASGKRLSASNETRLLRILDIVRRGHRASASETRLALLETTDGVSIFELLTQGKSEEAGLRLCVSSAPRSPSLVALSAEARRTRQPLAPAGLVDAKQDRVHRDVGIARAARTVRTGRRGFS